MLPLFFFFFFSLSLPSFIIDKHSSAEASEIDARLKAARLLMSCYFLRLQTAMFLLLADVRPSSPSNILPHHISLNIAFHQISQTGSTPSPAHENIMLPR